MKSKLKKISVSFKTKNLNSSPNSWKMFLVWYILQLSFSEFFLNLRLFLVFCLQFVQVETVVVSIVDYWPHMRPRKSLITLGICITIYLGSLVVCTNVGDQFISFLNFMKNISIAEMKCTVLSYILKHSYSLFVHLQSGIHWIKLMDQHVASYGILFAAFAELVALIYCYGESFSVVLRKKTTKMYQTDRWVLSLLCPGGSYSKTVCTQLETLTLQNVQMGRSVS